MGRLFLLGLFFGLIIIGLIYLLSQGQDGGDDWRDDDDTPEGPGPAGNELELPADKSDADKLHEDA